jgi:hypothetical protein
MSITAPLGFVQRGFGVQTKIHKTMENIRKLERIHERALDILHRLRMRAYQMESLLDDRAGYLNRQITEQRIRMNRVMSEYLREAYAEVIKSIKQ